MNMKLFLLLAQYEVAQVPLDKCASLFGLTPDEAAKRASRANLPVPVYRVGSQKSPWLIDIEDLADFLSLQRAQAINDWRKINGNSK